MPYNPYDHQWDHTKQPDPYSDPVEEILKYQTEFEKRRMDAIMKMLKEEPTLFNMEKKIQQTKQFLEKENTAFEHWRETAELYLKREELGRQRYGAHWLDKMKLDYEIKQLNKEIKLKAGWVNSSKEFFESYHEMQEMHQAVLEYAKEIQIKLYDGIKIWKEAIVRQVYDKYPELSGTTAGREIAPYLKIANKEAGRDLSWSDFQKSYKKNQAPETKRILDGFQAASIEKQVVAKQQLEQSNKQKTTQNQNQKNQNF